MEGMRFLSKPYVPSDGGDRVKTLETYINRRNAEVYLLLREVTRRLEALEKKLSEADSTSSE